MAPNINEIFDSFTQATIKTMQTMCNTQVSPLPIFVKGTQDQGSFDVAALIGLTSFSSKGSIGIYFPEAVFCHVLTKMLGEPVTTIDKTNEDATAELMNIIFGDAKVELNKLGHEIQMAIPTVLRGGKVVNPGSRLQSVTAIPFKTERGQFYVEFALSPLKDNDKVSRATEGGTLSNSQKAAFFKPFVDATISALKLQFNIEANPGKPSSKVSSDAFSFDIAGTIGITSRSLNGSYMVSFKKDIFLKLISKMLGEEFKELQPGLEDGVTELLNIILGNAKATLNDQQGHAIQMALPSLIYGETIHSSFQKGKTTIVIPFHSDIGTFMVEVSIA